MKAVSLCVVDIPSWSYSYKTEVIILWFVQFSPLQDQVFVDEKSRKKRLEDESMGRQNGGWWDGGWGSGQGKAGSGALMEEYWLNVGNAHIPKDVGWCQYILHIIYMLCMLLFWGFFGGKQGCLSLLIDKGATTGVSLLGKKINKMSSDAMRCGRCEWQMSCYSREVCMKLTSIFKIWKNNPHKTNEVQGKFNQCSSSNGLTHHNCP